MHIGKDKMTISPNIMRIDTCTQTIDIRQIENRRFLFNPHSGILVLGKQYGKTKGLPASHAQELADAGITKNFDSFVCGWIGMGKSYPHGIIHFAPCVDERNVSLFDRAFDTLEMFRENGAVAQTIIRGFGKRWEQPLFSILTNWQEPVKPSVRKQLDSHSATENRKQTQPKQQER